MKCVCIKHRDSFDLSGELTTEICRVRYLMEGIVFEAKNIAAAILVIIVVNSVRKSQ